MSGGMDIDWSARDRQLQRALKTHGSKSEEEILICHEELNEQLLQLHQQERELYEKGARLRRERDDLWALYAAHPGEVQRARDAIKETT